MQATIELNFPPMLIIRKSFGLMQAQEEPFTGWVRWPTGPTVQIESYMKKTPIRGIQVSGSIPPTYVRGFGFWKTVDACMGQGRGEDWEVLINLPLEPVRLKNCTMTALGIDAEIFLSAKGLGHGKGTIHFPDCPTKLVGIGRYLADAVTATGTMTF